MTVRFGYWDYVDTYGNSCDESMAKALIKFGDFTKIFEKLFDVEVCGWKKVGYHVDQDIVGQLIHCH
jgi:hypothetical protein